MAKGTRGRRRMASRSTPYPILTFNQNSNKNNSTKKDLEDINCSVCMEYPHNAVLLLCSSHDNGCRPYMCGTTSRYSNCLHQYKKAYTKMTFSSPPPLTTTVEEYGEVAELACPLCRGKVKGWTVVESAREYLNCKKRTCMHDNCLFIGSYKELKKHVKSEHPLTKPWEVDPDQEQKWRRLEQEREREDVISTVTSSMSGSVVFGDYVIERNLYNGSDSDDDDDEEGGFDVNGLGRVNNDDSGLVNVFLMFHAFGAGGNEVPFGNDVSGDGDDDGGGGMPLGRRRRSSQT